MTAHSHDAAPIAGPAAGQADTGPSLLALLVVLGGVFMSVLDFFIVNVAIPSIQHDLDASAAQIQWTVAGFGLGYGCGLITGGRLGDLYGRRRMYLWGMVAFALASAGCGLAPTAGLLVTARAAQGVAAALMAPQVLAIIRTAFTGRAQVRGFTLYGLTMGIAAVFGQLIGGLLIRADLFGSGWRACFLINLPVAVVVIALLPRLIPESRSPGRPRLDLPGAALVTSALALIVLPLIEGRAQGWPAWTWLSFVAAAVLLACFWAQERRLAARQGSPLVHPDLFGERAFTVGLLAQLVFWMGQASFFLVFALYAQQGRGLTALGAGTIFVAIGAGYLATSLSAAGLARRLGRQVLAAGGLTMAAGLGLLAAVVAHIGTGGNILLLAPGLVLDGAGMGLVIAPLTTTVLTQIPARYAGAGAGVMSTALQIGNALGVAVIGIIFYSALGTAFTAATYAHALLASVWFLIAIGLTLALLVQFMPRQRAAR